VKLVQRQTIFGASSQAAICSKILATAPFPQTPLETEAFQVLCKLSNLFEAWMSGLFNLREYRFQI
jgi:hypothetical protein